MNPSLLNDPAYFDVREIPCRIKHGQIFQRWLDLPVGQHFILVNDHDPVPLYYQFSAQFPGAFSWEYELRGPDEFHVRITKLAAVAIETETPASCADSAGTVTVVGDVEQIDARGLEPPEPLVRILAALESLAADRKLRAITDREPCHLFGEATQRGFTYACNAQTDGSWVTVLQRA